MRYSMVALQVQDLKQWLANFHGEDSKAARRAAGEKSWQLFYVAGEPNSVVLLNEWTDPARAREFLTSPALRKLQQESGVIGKPQAFLFDKAEQGKP